VFTATHSRPRLGRSQLSPAALLRATLDPLLIVLCLWGATLWYGDAFDGQYVILALIVFSVTFPGNPPQWTSVRTLAREVIVNWVVIVGILVFFGWATRTLTVFPEEVLLTWGLTVPVVAFIAHRTLPVLLPKLLALEGLQRTAVIAGAGEAGQKLAQELMNAPYLGIRFVGFFDDRSAQRLGPVSPGELLGKMTDLAREVKEQRIDLVFVTLPMASQPRIMRLLDELRDTTGSVYFMPDIFLFDLIQARMDTINGIPIVAVCETPFYGINGLIKRLSDIVIASVILILIAPLLVAIAIGVKLSSPGPVLFKQRRYGLDGRDITVYKFRSMTVCEDGDVIQQATKNDQRITPFGALIRRTSMDELPQFINVLQGRMSVVGPRPHAIAHNEMYRKLIKGYMVRHKVRPGITGLAQANGMRGETETLDKMKARIEYDLAYLRNWSLRLDLSIILRTIWVVLKGRNAY
jgi:putative colanic acid biosysnthesis UDP-glucose lipid carrier transferase